MELAGSEGNIVTFTSG